MMRILSISLLCALCGGGTGEGAGAGSAGRADGPPPFPGSSQHPSRETVGQGTVRAICECPSELAKAAFPQ